MTLILADSPPKQIGATSPVDLMKQNPDPTYCAICACPCLHPRLPTPLPDQPDESPSDSASRQLSTPKWLHQYHHLQPSRGILPYPYEHQSQKTQQQHRAYHLSPQQNIVPVHLHCLRAVIAITQSGMWNCKSDHPDVMMVGWTIPRWTGYGPWVRNSIIRPTYGMGWSGLADQKSRYVEGVEGSHLRSSDLISPETLDLPSYSNTLPEATVKSRAYQTSMLSRLPEHIITQTAQHLLLPSAPGGQSPSKRLDDLLALCRTCDTFRHLDLPEQTWSDLVLAAVNRFRDEQVRRWRANPTGSGGVSRVWTALDQTFVEPIENALSEVGQARATVTSALVVDTAIFSTGEVPPNASARDVLYWWLYSDVWRSRRRVWHSVIYACAAARNADWMWVDS